VKPTLAFLGMIITMAAIATCGVSDPKSSSVRKSDTPANAGPESTASRTSNHDGNTKARTLRFSGYDWTVKSSAGRVGPGPNYFSDSSDNVTVDAVGQLHLRITQRDGRWYCAEVISTRSFGYGTYRFYLNVTLDNLDPKVVLGMFTWSDDPAYNHREIDIEVSRWGQMNNKNGQFVVQPYTSTQNIVRFQIPSGLQTTTHIFTWKPDNTFCQSLKGHYAAPPEPGVVIQQHLFTKDIPQAGEENARINLWLLAGHTPADAKEAEVIISKFDFVKSY
jgi:hypothetical protein